MTTDSQRALPPYRILVVDDNQDALIVMRMLLQLQGHQVQTCTSGPQALEVIESYRPDAVLLDISMPGMDGYETCRRLRQQAWGRSVRVIALTGYGQDENRKLAQAAGFDGYLTKPVDLATLTNLLKSMPPATNSIKNQ